jgi:hypothetical protein
MKAQHEQERRKSKNPLNPKPQNSSDVTIKRKSEKTQGKRKTHPKPQNSSEKKRKIQANTYYLLEKLVPCNRRKVSIAQRLKSEEDKTKTNRVKWVALRMQKESTRAQ